MDTFSKPQIRALLTAARAARESDWLMILVGFCHALRASEVVGLTRDNIVGQHLVVKRLKGSERTTQELFEHDDPLFSERAPLIELAKNTPVNQKLFPISRATFWRRMQTYGERANLPKHLSHPHSLKHAFLSQMSENAPIAEVQNWGGHASIASTGKYLHPSATKIAASARRTLDV